MDKTQNVDNQYMFTVDKFTVRKYSAFKGTAPIGHPRSSTVRSNVYGIRMSCKLKTLL